MTNPLLHKPVNFPVYMSACSEFGGHCTLCLGVIAFRVYTLYMHVAPQLDYLAIPSRLGCSGSDLNFSVPSVGPSLHPYNFYLKFVFDNV